MQLSRFTDYSLRVLMYVATHPDRLVTLAEISDFYQVSLEHLRKVVHNLGKLGYLKTQRGKHGGMTMNVSAESINIGEAVAILEGDSPLIDCVGLNCNILPACGLPAALRKAQKAFYAELNQYTLKDMIKEKQLKRVFGEDVIYPPR